MKKRNHFQFLAIGIALLLLFSVSCDEDGDSFEPVNVKECFIAAGYFDNNELEILEEIVDLDSYEPIICNYIYNLINSGATVNFPKAFFQTSGCFSYPSKIMEAEVADAKLYLFDPFLSPTFTFYQNGYIESVGYGQELDWFFTDRENNEYHAEFVTCENHHPITFSCGLSGSLNEAIQMKWTSTESDDRLFLNFEWTPQGGEVQLKRGLELSDNGSYIFPPEALKKYGIENNGFLVFKVLRIKISEESLGSPFEKALVLTCLKSKIEIQLQD